MRKYPFFFLALSLLLSATACRQDPEDLLPDLPLAALSSPADWTNPPADDFSELRSAFLQTFDMENDIDLADRALVPVLMKRPASASRATVPVWNSPLSFTGGTISDYPEPGFTTTYTVGAEGGNIYRIVSTSDYPSANNLVDYYVEEYFVKDLSPLGSWGTEDPVVDASGNIDQTYRERMEIHFLDGSVRYEQIVKILGPSTGESGFAPFDINASLYYPDFAYPATDADAQFSSVVIYSQDINTAHDYWFWDGTVSGALLGVRFYTEHFVEAGAYYKGTTAAYERAVKTYTTMGGDFARQLDDVFIGSEHTTLAESVMRKEVVFQVSGGLPTSTALGANTVMRTHVVDTAGTAEDDFLLQLLNEDGAVFTDWNGAPYHIPSGTTAEEIAYTIPAAEVVVELYADNPDGSDLPLLVESLPGNSDLAFLYRAIAAGAVDIPIDDPEDEIGSNDLPTTPDGETQTLVLTVGNNPVGGVAVFDGDSGYEVPFDPDDPAINPIEEGTVEAWVYVEKHADTAGIVHKGVEHDFSDEGYTLQFWGKNGNVAFGIVRQDPSYSYKLVTSAIRLNKGKWYYLAGTWDEDNVRLYIFYDDTYKNYSTANNLANAPYPDSGPLVIGSQYMEEYGKTGYYGFEGSIYGVVVSTYAKEPVTLQNFYNANKGKTAGWHD